MYLSQQLQHQMTNNNSALGWTPGPNGWTPVALGTSYLPPGQQQPQRALGALGQAKSGMSPIMWLALGAVVYAFRSPILDFIGVGESAAKKAVAQLKHKVEGKAAGEARRRRRRNRK